MSEVFPPHPPRDFGALGGAAGRYGLEVMMEDESVRIVLERDGRIREIESTPIFEGGQRVQYRYEYGADVSVELPEVERELVCS